MRKDSRLDTCDTIDRLDRQGPCTVLLLGSNLHRSKRCIAHVSRAEQTSLRQVLASCDGDGRSFFCRNACLLRWIDMRVLVVRSDEVGCAAATACVASWKRDCAMALTWVGYHVVSVVGSSTVVGLLRVFRRSIVGDCLMPRCLFELHGRYIPGPIKIWLSDLF